MARLPRLFVVIGHGSGWREDFAGFQRFAVPHDVCCINRVGIEFPGDFRFWFSYHSTELMEWREKRVGATTAELLTCGPKNPGIRHLRLRDTKGSSSLMATRIARGALGYDKVVLCGVPLSGEYHAHFFRHWAEAYGELFPFVRSMSDHTRNLLGEPTQAWLETRHDNQ